MSTAHAQQVATAAVDADVHVVGVSSLAAGHKWVIRQRYFSDCLFGAEEHKDRVHHVSQAIAASACYSVEHCSTDHARCEARLARKPPSKHVCFCALTWI